MKSMILSAVFFLFASTASAEVECSNGGFLGFKVAYNHNTETWHGEGVDGYLNFKFNCKMSSKNQWPLRCVSPVANHVTGKKFFAVITPDKDGVVTAIFRGFLYNRTTRIGCIIRE